MSENTKLISIGLAACSKWAIWSTSNYNCMFNRHRFFDVSPTFSRVTLEEVVGPHV
jgi:hypothetical protein